MPPQRLKSCPHGPMCHIEFVSQEASWERLDCSVHTGSWRSWGQNWRRNWRLLSSSCSRKLIARPIANLKKLLGPLGLLGPVATLGQPFLRESGRPHQGHGRGFCCQAGKVLARALDACAKTQRISRSQCCGHSRGLLQPPSRRSRSAAWIERSYCSGRSRQIGSISQPRSRDGNPGWLET